MMSNNNLYSHASVSRANDPTVMPREKLRRPAMYLAPVVEHRVGQQQAERIRGGCFPCPGGSIWVFDCSGTGAEGREQSPSPRVPHMRQIRLSQSSQPPRQPSPPPRRSSPPLPQPSHLRPQSPGAGSELAPGSELAHSLQTDRTAVGTPQPVAHGENKTRKDSYFRRICRSIKRKCQMNVEWH